MVTYDITAVVAAELSASYEKYMAEQHIPDLLATGYFAGASFGRNGERYNIRYEAHSQEALDQYIANDANRLRADFSEHFPSGVEISRVSWEVLALFPQGPSLNQRSTGKP